MGGIQFQTGSDETLLESISWWGLTFNSGGTFIVSLYDEGTSTSYGNLVGAVGTASTGSPFTGTYLTVEPEFDLILAANTRYWIGFSAPDGQSLMGIKVNGDGSLSTLADYTSALGWTGTGAFNIGVSGNGESTVYPMNVNVSVVPEVSSFALSIIGGLMVCLRRSRRS